MISRLCPKWGSSYFSFCWLIVMAITMGVGFLTGCQDFEANAYKALKTSATVYDTGMRSTSDLFDAGLITEQQMNTIVDAGVAYRMAYLTACDLLEAYHETGNASDQEKFNAAVAEYSAALVKMTSLLNQYRARSDSPLPDNANPDGISRADPGTNTIPAKD
ncbi:MAG: hypothetical protein JEZ12_23985 [Desulfobacterium sp.]|nr:hypothetical protein [Desulfobacterium sp.]